MIPISYLDVTPIWTYHLFRVSRELTGAGGHYGDLSNMIRLDRPLSLSLLRSGLGY